MRAPTLTRLPDWPALVPYLHLSYDLKIVRRGKPRIRVAAVPPTATVRARLLAVRCACATCGAQMTPFRESATRHAPQGGMYVAVTCGYRVGEFGCGHSAKAHAEYERIRAAVEGLAPADGTQARLAL